MELKRIHLITSIVLTIAVGSVVAFVMADVQFSLEQNERELKDELKAEQLAKEQKQSQLEGEQLAKEQKQSQLEGEQLAKEQKQSQLEGEQLAKEQKQSQLEGEQLAKEQKQRELERPLTVEVDNTSYQTGDIIRVSGIGPVDSTVRIGIDNPRNESYKFASVTVKADKTYSFEFMIYDDVLCGHKYIPSICERTIDGIYTIEAEIFGYSSESRGDVPVYTTFELINTNSNAYAKEVIVEQVPGASNANNDEYFVPSEVTINVGDTVIWQNNDSGTHTVTSGIIDDPSKWSEIFESGFAKPGVEYQYTFDTAGDYPYLCQLHPWMIGKVIVKAAIT